MEETAPFYRALGKRVREVRLERGLKQGQLAAIVGLTRASVTNLELGRQRILAHTLVDIARALDVDATALLSSSEARQHLRRKDFPSGLSRQEQQWIQKLVNEAAERSHANEA